MRNLQEYGLWLVLVIICAVIVSQWMNFLILMSDAHLNCCAVSRQEWSCTVPQRPSRTQQHVVYFS